MSYNIHSFFLFFFFTISAFSSSLNGIHKCSQKQSHALFLFKQSLSSINFSINSQRCQDWLGSSYHPKLMNWNTNSDCCDWNGVICENSTGYVIGLDLSCGMLQGTIDSNSSLFHLPHLRRLNIAFNDFSGSKIPHEIGMLSHTLTHLNISTSRFSGEVPSEISLLSKLVSLDLSASQNGFNIESYVFTNMLRNLSILEELSLVHVDISSPAAYLNFSSCLRLLNLRLTGLQGNLPPHIFKLRYMENLDLSRNNLAGHIPSEIALPKLVALDLSFTGLEIQPRIFISLLQNCTSLRNVLLNNVSIGLVLPTYLNISSSLKTLVLNSTSLQGKLPDNIFSLQYLEVLDLSYNYLTGSLPKANRSVPLKSLDLSSCGLAGSLPSSLFSLPSLEYMYLTTNKFSGNVPFTLFSLPSLKKLSIGENSLSGEIDVLDQGHVLQSLGQLTNLTFLDLSYNNLSGKWELETLLSSLKNLVDLDLSYSGLTITTNNANRYVNSDFNSLKLTSCKLKVLPESLRRMKNLKYLDLSNNKISGSIPDWAGEIGGDVLYHLDLSNNLISHLPQFQWHSLECIYLQSNKIQGPFPLSICNMSSLFALDMSNNNFSGVIPNCFGNFKSFLRIINLRNNHFNGPIPNAYNDCESLEGLILNGNQFEGEVPSVLSKCQKLKVVDLGNNHLNGSFPRSLGYLRNLQVLILKSNKFHGPIVTSSTHELQFQCLQVLDLSYNRFVGQLPGKYFENLKVMKDVVKRSTKAEYVFVDGRYYSITITIKGVLHYLPQIFVHYTIIDVSNNGFQGEIPNIIGSLNSLKLLNLSHNNLVGKIPQSLGSLSEIESIDLSSNQLKGEIPKELVNIHGLSLLNLSQNHLEGHIPRGTQFNTFDASSYEGNVGLCGFPLPECELLSSPQHKDDGHDDDGYTWKAALLGYGCGTIIGLALGYIMLSTGKPKRFNKISNSMELMVLKMINKQR